jgi:hypothetical protein
MSMSGTNRRAPKRKAAFGCPGCNSKDQSDARGSCIGGVWCCLARGTRMPPSRLFAQDGARVLDLTSLNLLV